MFTAVIKRTAAFLFFIVFFQFPFLSQTEKEDSLLFITNNFQEKNITVYFIPVNIKVKKDFLESVKPLYSKSKINFYPFLLPKYQTEKDEFWSNPPLDSLRYSKQMKVLRDKYFKSFPSKDPNAIYYFLIKGFTDEDIHAYSVPTKALGFIKYQEDSTFLKSLAFHLGSTLGLEASLDSSNIMHPIFGNQLTWKQCLQIRSFPISYSLFDDYEFVRTNNGLNAYYFWNEDKDGWIEIDSTNPLKSIIRPFKRNSLSYYVKIDNVFFNPLFKIYSKTVCAMHLIGICIALIILLFIRYKLNKRITDSGFLKRQTFRSLKFATWIGSIALIYLAFWLVDWYYQTSILKSHHLKDFKGLSTQELMEKMNDKDLFSKSYNTNVSSFVFQRKDQEWYVFQKEKVMYFDLKKVNDTLKARFAGSKNRVELKTIDYVHPAQSHYMIFRTKDSTGRIIKEQIFSHLGVNLTKRYKMKDPAKRILVFVNGYRPVSISNSLENNIEDVKNKGVEYPDSKNYLYSYDRYNYWRPWNEIDLLFQKRINPSEVWYADGHHTVATSNHLSLVNFSTNAGIYPKPCKRNKHHVCKYTTITGKKKVKTIGLLALKPNIDGFRLRKKRGRIAGKNLNQILNELPNNSLNDTLYIVSHSMGYAYSLGIIEEMRGKIQFGACYIIAPENAKSGKIVKDEWREVWQYGAKLYGKGKNAPCQQDGVAPQVCVRGLKEKDRIYFPKKMERKMGYFQSHFVGYYTWILNIDKNQKGHVKQH